MSRAVRGRATLAAFSRAKLIESVHVRNDPALLFPSPPGVIKHGDSTTQDREHVSDGYTVRHYDSG